MGRATIERPDDIKCTLEFSMTLGEWKNVRKTLRNNQAWAENQLIADITDIINKIEQTFHNDFNPTK